MLDPPGAGRLPGHGRGERRRPAETVTLGTLMSLTGDLAAYGGPIQKATDLAAEQINAQGGFVGGKQLALTHRNDQTNAQAGVDAAQKLVSIDRVPAFVGALASSVTLPVAGSVSAPNQVVQISPASTAAEITTFKDNGFLFRTVASDTLQGVVLADLAQERGFNRVSVIYINNPYGAGLDKSFSEAFKEKGGQIVASTAFEPNQASYRGELRELAKSGSEALVVVAYPENGINIVRQALEEGFFTKFLFPDGMKAPEIIEAIGARFLNGTYGTAAEAKPGQEGTSRFARAYQARFGEVPPKPYMQEAYDAVFVLAMAIEKAGKATGPAIRDALSDILDPKGETVYAGEWQKARQLIKAGKKVRYEGASGLIAFDRNGDRSAATIGVWKIENGKIVTDRIIEVQR